MTATLSSILATNFTYYFNHQRSAPLHGWSSLFTEEDRNFLEVELFSPSFIMRPLIERLACEGNSLGSFFYRPRLDEGSPAIWAHLSFPHYSFQPLKVDEAIKLHEIAYKVHNYILTKGYAYITAPHTDLIISPSSSYALFVERKEQSSLSTEGLEEFWSHVFLYLQSPQCPNPLKMNLNTAIDHLIDIVQTFHLENITEGNLIQVSKCGGFISLSSLKQCPQATPLEGLKQLTLCFLGSSEIFNRLYLHYYQASHDLDEHRRDFWKQYSLLSPSSLASQLALRFHATEQIPPLGIRYNRDMQKVNKRISEKKQTEERERPECLPRIEMSYKELDLSLERVSRALQDLQQSQKIASWFFDPKRNIFLVWTVS